jgi:hypothetical protein
MIEMNAPCIDRLLERIAKKRGSQSAEQLKLASQEITESCIRVYSDKFGIGDIGLGGSGVVSNLYTPISSDDEIPNGTTGLIYGKVQSGKTITTIATLALLSANHYKCFIVITSDNTWLGEQTAKRFKNELDGGPRVFYWEQWRRDPQGFALKQKAYVKDTGVVLVSTKNIKHLEGLLEVLKVLDAKHFPSIIFDDEADNASLNTNEAKQSKKGKRSIPDSAIFDAIGKIRKKIPNHIYLQITATPQSLLLQSLHHQCKPAFCKLLEPGNGYMGGDLFFAENSLYRVFYNASELDILKGGAINPGNDWGIPDGLGLALCCFFLGTICKMLKSGDSDEIYSFLIHICHRKINHTNVESIIGNFVARLDQSLRDRRSETEKKTAMKYFEKAYSELKKTTEEIPDLNVLIDELKHKLRNAIPKVINADNPNKEPDYNPGMNILIGGNRLGRGVTIEGLMITYYGRDAKQKMMDTVHQHARMFGYRENLKEFTRLFVPDHIFNDFCAIHESDEGMRDLIGDEPSQLSVKPVWVGQALKPTRSNVLNPSEISAFTPGIQTYPRDPKWKKTEIRSHTEALDELLKHYGNDDDYHEVGIDFLIQLLGHTPSRPVPGQVWEDNRVCEALKAMKIEGIIKGRLNVRRGKDGEGLGLTRKDFWGKDSFFTSSVTRQAKERYPDVPTLVLGYQKGEKIKRWDDQPLYLPTIVFPRNQFIFMFNYSE